MKPSDDELRKIVDHPTIKPGDKWFYKASGSVYVVIGVCLIESNLEPHVAYCLAKGSFVNPLIWSRPVAEFLDKFKRY